MIMVTLGWLLSSSPMVFGLVKGSSRIAINRELSKTKYRKFWTASAIVMPEIQAKLKDNLRGF